VTSMVHDAVSEAQRSELAGVPSEGTQAEPTEWEAETGVDQSNKPAGYPGR
jgi:hypothetical protein